MAYGYGWSSARGRARHLVKTSIEALCGAPIRLVSLDGIARGQAKRLLGLEVCDHCQNARRRLRGR